MHPQLLPVIVIVIEIGIGIATGTGTDIVTVTVKESANENDHVASPLLGRRGEMNLHTADHLLNLPRKDWRTKVILLLSDMFLARKGLCNMSIWIPSSLLVFRDLVIRKSIRRSNIIIPKVSY
jgi:hypothetical protein